MSQRQEQETSGCAITFLAALVIGTVVAAVISVAALVDPFSWMPPVGEIWKDCQDSYEIPGDECALARRYPGFWLHVVVNFAYAVVAAGLLIWLAAAVSRFRETRARRFADRSSLEAFGQARTRLRIASGVLSLVAAMPIVAALA